MNRRAVIESLHNSILSNFDHKSSLLHQMWTETSSFAGFTSTSDSSNITKIPGVGNPALYMLQIPEQNTNTASEGKTNYEQHFVIGN